MVCVVDKKNIALTIQIQITEKKVLERNKIDRFLEQHQVK
jgi:hypothetical protein